MKLLRFLGWGFLGAILALLAARIVADDANVSWDAPTTNTDGSPLTDLAGYILYRSVDGGNFEVLADIDNAGVVSYLDGDLFDGEYCYYVTAYRLGPNDVRLESDASNTGCKTIDTLLPSAPSGLQVN